jgi:outer membrane lipase/esterase
VRGAAMLCVTATAGLGAQSGQAATPLSDFVNNPANGATAFEQAVGNSVQGMCTFLQTPAGGGFNTTTSNNPNFNQPSGDLFLRCNELVRTAAQFNNQGARTDRSLNYSDIKKLLGALHQVSGEEITAQGSLATQVPYGQFSNIASRLSALRYGSFNSVMRGRASALNWGVAGDGDAYHYASQNYNSGYFTRDGGSAQFLHSSMTSAGDVAPGASNAASAEPAISSPWGVFVEGTYNFGKRDQTSSSEEAYDFKARSVTAGVDYDFGSAVIGASVGYDKYTADFRSNAISVPGGGAQVKGTSGSLFGAWFGDHWTFNGIASYGTLKTDVTRIVSYSPDPMFICSTPCGVQNRTLSGSPGGHDTAVGATVGYDFNASSWTLSPTVSLNYRQVKIDAYSESEFNAPATGGGLALAYDSQSVDSLRSVIGVAATRPFSQSFGVLSPNFSLEWQHEYKDQSRTINAGYVVDSALTKVGQFPIQTDAAAKNFGIIGVGLTALFSHRLQAYVTYERLVGISYLTSNAVSIGFRGQL